MTEPFVTVESNSTIEELQQRLADAEAGTTATVQALARRGINLDQGGITAVRLTLLLDHMLGGLDSRSRLEFEIAVQAAITLQLREVESQVSRARLLHGVNGNGLDMGKVRG